MGTAAYVGRVGGLAVALGVGSAVFAGHGVAWADDTDSPATKSSVSATSQSKTDDSSEAADKAAESKDDSEPAAGSDDETEQQGEDTVEVDDPIDEDEDDPEPEPEPADESDPVEDPAPVDVPKDETPATKPASDDVEESQTTKATKAAKADIDKADDPGVPPQDGKTVTLVTDAPTSTNSTSTNSTSTSPTSTNPATTVTALLGSDQDDEATTKKPNLITAIVNVVNSMIDWAHQKADTKPGDEPQPPFLWALMAFARRELDTLFTARTTNAPRSSAVAPTSLALTDSTSAAALAAANSPWLNPQVSASTKFIDWVTGPYANIPGRFNIYGTDLGIMWDNGMVDDPTTPNIDERQILIAVGDSFGLPGMQGRHIYNTLFRSNDHDLSDGITIRNGEWFNGNMFGGAPLDGPTQARPIINRPSWLPGSVTLIPTAGVSIVTPDDPLAKFGVTQYVSFMSVTKWGQAGRWTTNYSAVAYSYDNGENFTVAPESVRYNSFLSGNRNFQQSAYVKGDDGYVYVYGTPNGRQGAAYLARVTEDNVLNVSQYEYYKKATKGWFGSTTPARWVKGSPSSASAIIGKSGGLFGITKPGYTVSEMSVQYNEYLKKYVVLYGDQANRIVMRTSDTPEGVWSDATVLMNQQTGGIYAPMLHPWSPSTEGVGSKLYWNLSLWSDYNIMLMETDLSKI
ncbi:DUF4185 domain-containing protein [Mycobacterium sp. 236(2023)]|uniref:DUF4185 domain-containing protein n=1 Tax=Mycobacterium sp. 236(2023) TaxID=3038163 RepID=UPI0024154A30|nr:DUF4185 domain-containing protein [Mycobacterium sp. 236(2023)]MDG4665466.1 DUF4185 domain-containing protein [Mycobacterium sp. 236(2023)]